MSGITAALTGIHICLASLTKQDHWLLANDEAETLSKNVENVVRHYPALQGHEKAIDWLMLLQALAMTYGTRIYLSMPEKPAPRKVAEHSAPGNITQFGVVN